MAELLFLGAMNITQTTDDGTLSLARDNMFTFIVSNIVGDPQALVNVTYFTNVVTLCMDYTRHYNHV